MTFLNFFLCTKMESQCGDVCTETKGECFAELVGRICDKQVCRKLQKTNAPLKMGDALSLSCIRFIVNNTFC